jgi:NAD(P)-dependent dehydrogenase (short-subunit alcohol dehydrogenase family)
MRCCAAHWSGLVGLLTPTPRGVPVNAAAPQLLGTATNAPIFPADVLAHAVRPEAVADTIASLVSERSAPISGTVVPAYGA